MSTKKHKVRALSICGGGIKGIIPAYIMMELEKKLQEMTASPDERIANYIDLFSGTSVGGILTAMYLAPIDTAGHLRSAKEVYQLIAESMKTVFYLTPSGQVAPNPDYSTQKGKEFFTDLFKNLQLKNLVKPTLITAYEPNRHWISFFRQQHAAIDPAANFLLSDVCLSTGAMPVYFNPAVVQSFSEKKITEHSFMGAINDSSTELGDLLVALREVKFINADGEILVEMDHARWDTLQLPEKWDSRKKIIYSVMERAKNSHFTFIDGAVFANNPSICTLTEAANMHFEIFDQNRPKLPEMLLISLGTGFEVISEPYSHAISSKFTSQFMSTLFECAESLAHFQCLHTFSSAGLLNQYHHLDPLIKPLPSKTVPTSKFYDVRPDNIEALEDLVAAYVEKHRPDLNKIVADLIKESQ